MKILAIDPGLANTGVVLLDRGEITRSTTIKSKPWEKPKRAKITTEEVIVRARSIAADLETLIDREHPDHIAIEGYTDYGGGVYRNATNRWTTPMVIGVIAQWIMRECANSIQIHYQQPEIVLTSQAAIKKAWSDGIVGLVGGDFKLTNDHTRSAALHALHLHYQLKIKEART